MQRACNGFSGINRLVEKVALQDCIELTRHRGGLPHAYQTPWFSQPCRRTDAIRFFKLGVGTLLQWQHVTRVLHNKTDAKRLIHVVYRKISRQRKLFTRFPFFNLNGTWPDISGRFMHYLVQDSVDDLICNELNVLSPQPCPNDGRLQHVRQTLDTCWKLHLNSMFICWFCLAISCLFLFLDRPLDELFLHAFGTLPEEVRSSTTRTPPLMLPHERRRFLDQNVEGYSPKFGGNFNLRCFEESLGVIVVNYFLILPTESSA